MVRRSLEVTLSSMLMDILELLNTLPILKKVLKQRWVFVEEFRYIFSWIVSRFKRNEFVFKSYTGAEEHNFSVIFETYSGVNHWIWKTFHNKKLWLNLFLILYSFIHCDISISRKNNDLRKKVYIEKFNFLWTTKISTSFFEPSADFTSLILNPF